MPTTEEQFNDVLIVNSNASQDAELCAVRAYHNRFGRLHDCKGCRVSATYEFVIAVKIKNDIQIDIITELQNESGLDEDRKNYLHDVVASIHQHKKCLDDLLDEFFGDEQEEGGCDDN